MKSGQRLYELLVSPIKNARSSKLSASRALLMLLVPYFVVVVLFVVQFMNYML